MIAGRVANGLIGTMLDFALPPRCPSCGTIVTQQHSFCIPCWREIRFLGDPGCVRCGRPFAFAQGEGAECGACIADPPAFDRLRAAAAYGEVTSRVALKLKYGGKPAVATTVASFLHRHLEEEAGDAILVPVPLHRWRIWKRGYNQAALIASTLARRSGRTAVLDLIERSRATPSLRGLGRRERARAIQGAFRIDTRKRTLVEGRDVVLVDDVYTSGATANGCARVLKRAGAARVNILCWARVVPDEER